MFEPAVRAPGRSSPPHYPPPVPPSDLSRSNARLTQDAFGEELERALLQLQNKLDAVFSEKTPDTLKGFIYVPPQPEYREALESRRSWSILYPLFCGFPLSQLKTLALVNQNWNLCARKVVGEKMREEGAYFLKEVATYLKRFGGEYFDYKKDQLEDFREGYTEKVEWAEYYPLPSQAKLIDLIACEFSKIFEFEEVQILQYNIAESPFTDRFFQLYNRCGEILEIVITGDKRTKFFKLNQHVHVLLREKYFDLAMITAEHLPECGMVDLSRPDRPYYDPKKELIERVRHEAAAEGVIIKAKLVVNSRAGITA